MNNIVSNKSVSKSDLISRTILKAVERDVLEKGYIFI